MDVVGDASNCSCAGKYQLYVVVLGRRVIVVGMVRQSTLWMGSAVHRARFVLDFLLRWPTG